MAVKAEDRQKALDTALAQIDRQFGKGSIMRLGDESAQKVKVIPTGSVALDVALGIGGLREAASLRSTARNPPVHSNRRPPCGSNVRRLAASLASSMRSTPSTRPTPASSVSTPTH